MLERLERVDRLEREGAPAALVLDEVRALLVEAEAWARRAGPEAGRARAAAERASAALAEGREPVHAL